MKEIWNKTSCVNKSNLGINLVNIKEKGIQTMRYIVLIATIMKQWTKQKKYWNTGKGTCKSHHKRK